LAALVIAVLCVLLISLVIRAANKSDRRETHRRGMNLTDTDTQPVCAQTHRVWLFAKRDGETSMSGRNVRVRGLMIVKGDNHETFC